jgi:predicted nucleic acid-binding protein
MIILDTNVISEAMRPSANPVVMQWLDRQAAETLCISSVSLAELLFGIGVLTQGKRKAALQTALEGLMKLFTERVLPFDGAAAQCYADQAISARRAGQGFPLPDGYIAAIAAANGFAVATRDTAPFRAAGLNVIDPWE